MSTGPVQYNATFFAQELKQGWQTGLSDSTEAPRNMQYNLSLYKQFVLTDREST